MAQQQAAAARAGLGSAAAQMRYATLTAPFAGIITQKLANVGDLAAPGKPVLMLENQSRLQVQTSVSSDVFNHLKLGDGVSGTCGQGDQGDQGGDGEPATDACGDLACRPSAPEI